MTQPLPGQLALDLAGLEESPVGAPTMAPDVKYYGPAGENAATARPAAVGSFMDVPPALRVFADVDRARLRAENWRFWDPGTAPATAAREYRARLGAWPELVTVNPVSGHTLAGPLPSEVRT